MKLKWQGVEQTLSLLCDPADPTKAGPPACFPGREESRKLLLGNLLFPFTNADFAGLMGIMYWLLAMPFVLWPRWDMGIIIGLIFCGAFVSYTRYQEKADRPVIYLTSLLQGLAHTGAVLGLAHLLPHLDPHLPAFSGTYGFWWLLFTCLVEVGILGGLIGAFIFGLNLLITSLWFDMNHNDAFSAMRLESYKNFLRLRITDDEITVYAIGLKDMPKRSEWIDTHVHQGQPRYKPKTPLRPQLLERVRVVPLHRDTPLA